MKRTKNYFNKENSSSDGVDVYCRIRPIKTGTEACVRAISDVTVQCIPPADYKKDVAGKECSFKFVFNEDFNEEDGIRNEAQRDVYKMVALPLVEDLVKGRDALLFTYGVTSSGKTHTMTGKPGCPGILPRSLDTIFASLQPFLAPKGTFRPDGRDRSNGFTVVDAGNMTDLEKTEPRSVNGRRQDLDDWSNRRRDAITVEVPQEYDDVKMEYGVFVSYVEVYNKKIYDLLQADDGKSAAGKIVLKPRDLREIRDTPSNEVIGVYVQGVNEVEVRSADEALTLFARGSAIRRTAPTNLNPDSSRSHAVFTIRIAAAPRDKKSNKILDLVAVSQLSLVDLAGSERAKRTNNTGDQLKEGAQINGSLMSLRNCLDALRFNQRQKNPDRYKVVPYRDYKLTEMFQVFLTGKRRFRMIVCVNPKASEFAENMKVLEFAESTQTIELDRGPQVRFDELVSSGRRMMQRAILMETESSDETSRSKRKVADLDEVDRPNVPIKSVKYRYESFVRQVDVDNKFPNYELCGHNDSETLMALIRHLEDRVRRHKHTYEDLKKQEEEFYESLCRLGAERQSLQQTNQELRKDLQAARILMNQQNEQMDDMEEQLTQARNLLQEISKRCVGRTSNQSYEERIRTRIREFLEKKPTKRPITIPKPALTPSSVAIAGTRKKIEWGATSSGTATPTAPPLSASSTSERIQFSVRAEYAPSPLHQSTASSRSRFEASRAAFNHRHPGRRSKSADQRTVVKTHKHHVPLGTVLQPHISKENIVTAPPSAEQLKKASQMIVIDQKTNDMADIQTELWRGKVIPTVGQGSAVIFESVEQHTQVDARSPGMDEYSYGMKRQREPSVSRDEVQQRCMMSFSHKSPAKKSPSKSGN